jgi:hypothetical protein
MCSARSSLVASGRPKQGDYSVRKEAIYAFFGAELSRPAAKKLSPKMSRSLSWLHNTVKAVLRFNLNLLRQVLSL